MLKYMTFSYPSPTVSPFVKKKQNNSEPFLSKLFGFFFLSFNRNELQSQLPIKYYTTKAAIDKIPIDSAKNEAGTYRNES